MYRRIIKILLIVSLFFIIPEVAQAGFLDDIFCIQTGNCDLSDIAAGFNSLIKLLLGGMGAVALIYFVWGGIRWLVSGGSAERIRDGKNIMINTAFALILAFGSYILVSFFVNDVLKVKTEYQITKGPFVTCEGSARGTACGVDVDGEGTDPYSACSGIVEGKYSYLSNRCLSKCQVASLDRITLAECSSKGVPIPVGWGVFPGSGSWCEEGKICLIQSSSLLIPAH